MGRSADQGGRPTTPLGPPTFPFFVWAVLQAHLSLDCVSAFVFSVSISGGPSNPCDAHVAEFDWMASCSFAEKDMIALNF